MGKGGNKFDRDPAALITYALPLGCELRAER